MANFSTSFFAWSNFSYRKKKNACLLLYTQKLANIIMNVMNSTTKWKHVIMRVNSRALLHVSDMEQVHL